MAMQDFQTQRRLDRLITNLEKIGDVTISRNMAILSLVGRNMRNAIGSAGLMFASLAKAMINIEMISQGASEINISCGESPSPLDTIAIRLTLGPRSHRGKGRGQGVECDSRLVLDATVTIDAVRSGHTPSCTLCNHRRSFDCQHIHGVTSRV